MPLAVVRDLAEWEHGARPSEAASSLNTLPKVPLDEFDRSSAKNTGSHKRSPH